MNKFKMLYESLKYKIVAKILIKTRLIDMSRIRLSSS